MMVTVLRKSGGILASGEDGAGLLHGRERHGVIERSLAVDACDVGYN